LIWHLAADAWAHWNDQYGSDHPLQGLTEIIQLGGVGYLSLGRAWLQSARQGMAGWRKRFDELRVAARG
jgi:hypothetical protein